MNTLKVGVLLVALTALFILVGDAIGGRSGAMIAFALALLMNFASYWFSDKIVLGMYGARPLSPADAPELYRLTERLAERAGIPVPRLYVVPGDQPNAFATGRSPANSAVAVTEGLLRLLDRDEVEGVIAHEIAHIRHRDTLTMTVVATIAGAVMLLADMARWAMIFGGARSDDREGGNPLVYLFIMIVAPIAAMLIQLAISRAREYEADATGARLAGNPDGLINALRKLEQASRMIPMQASPSTAHLFIVNPLRGVGGTLVSLFMTHPPIEERIRRLQQMRGSEWYLGS
ncbi:MAG: zinc metalloprotease HtpX [Chthonomonadetes bacterium]|nr:zinc metalloprotease HtpX [Chthonomonadetes bacterium]